MMEYLKKVINLIAALEANTVSETLQATVFMEVIGYRWLNGNFL